MTKEQNIETIRQACIKANPEIVELKFGCRIEDFMYGQAVIVGIEKYKGESDCYYQFYDKIPEPKLNLSPQNFNWTIIGRPIRLADVLLVIPENHSLSIGILGYFENWILVEGDTYKLKHFKGIKWNLLKDSLEEQSEETLTFISNLLT